jgi:tRNA(Ile)-lysidine synthase
VSAKPSLEARFRAQVASVGAAPGDAWVVAVSGGLDSVVLLHLLRSAAPVGVRLVAAHFDHAMRPESAGDALWVRGLTQAWGVEAREGRARAPITSEAEARDARYAYLESVRVASGARLVLTAHHADDQAETVLFRALRGTGQAGLTGMASLRGAIFRPLLSMWRSELEAYAQSQALSWREDATNASLGYARNALRRSVLPDIERLVAPGARRALVRLADLAREDEAGWQSVLPAILATRGREEGDGIRSAESAKLAGLHPAVMARVLRSMVAGVGGSMNEDATRRTVGFVMTARSGQSIDLGQGVTLRKDLERIGVTRRTDVPVDRHLVIPDAGPGSGSARLSGRDVPVSWGRLDATPGRLIAAFDPARLRFPLAVRAREPGDRIRVTQGPRSVSKKVKRLLLERRIPSPERACIPLVIDAAGDVLWIPGIARAPGSESDADGLCIGIG